MFQFWVWGLGLGFGFGVWIRGLKMLTKSGSLVGSNFSRGLGFDLFHLGFAKEIRAGPMNWSQFWTIDKLK